MDISIVAACTHLPWSPRIGDPSLLAWLTVAAYVLAAALCLRVAMQPGRLFAPGSRIRQMLFWLLLALGLLLLGANKQLDLQTLLTAFGRCVARHEGWYAQRRAVQVEFIYFVLAAGALALLLVAYVMRDCWRPNLLGLVGIAILGCFVAIRAASFHHVDQLIQSELFGTRLAAILELAGIGLVALAAALRPLWILKSAAPARRRL